MPRSANRTLSLLTALLSLLVGSRVTASAVCASAALCSAPNFRPAPVYNTGLGPSAVAVGDFNNDGRPDLATANANAGSLSILVNDGTGAFLPANNFTVGQFPTALAVGDFNRDGKTDVLTANVRSSDVSVLLGDGTGNFRAARSFNVGQRPGAVAVADFNGDGIADLATANILTPPEQIFFTYSASVLLGNGAGGFSTPSTLPIGVTPWAIASGDLNGDGSPDLVTANFASGDLSVFFNRCPSAPATGPAVLSFSASDYAVGKGDGSVTVTVNRTGDNAGAASVTYATRGGTASDRSDYISSFGTLRFAPGETAKTFKVLIIDDAYVDNGFTSGAALPNN
jgi:hypothetical protein